MPGAGCAPLTGYVALKCSLASVWPIQICVLGNNGDLQVIHWRRLSFLNIRLVRVDNIYLRYNIAALYLR